VGYILTFPVSKVKIFLRLKHKPSQLDSSCRLPRLDVLSSLAMNAILLTDFVENRLLWIDSHQFAMLSWDLINRQVRIVDEFTRADKGLSGIAVFEVTYSDL